MTMTAATLFSGIGAPEVAMPDWRWAWHAEIEKFPSAVMAARHPGSINLGDVSADGFTERAAAIARPDVLVFGSPCQSFSVAGKRLGLDDPRGNLALVALGIVDRLKPRWFVFENVPGLLSSYSGAEHAERAVREGDVGGQADGEEDRDIAAFVARFQDIGYRGCSDVLDAQWFGVAQRRERLFFVGHLGDWRPAAAVLLEPEGLRGNHPPRRQAGQGTAPTISARPTGGGGLGTDFDCDGGLIAFGGNDTRGPIDVATARNAHGGPHGRMDFESETFVTHALRADGFDASEDGTGRGTPIVASPLTASMSKSIARSGKEVGLTNGIVQAVALRGREGGGTAELSDIPPALRAGGGGGDKAHILTSSVRRLTPRECERLQGFPDDYTLIRYPTHSAKTGKALKRPRWAADGPRYKALGNSMAVPVIRWILNRIEIFETQVRPIIERAA